MQILEPYLSFGDCTTISVTQHLKQLAEIQTEITRGSLYRVLSLDGYGLKAIERNVQEMLSLGFLEKIDENTFRIFP